MQISFSGKFFVFPAFTYLIQGLVAILTAGLTQVHATGMPGINEQANVNAGAAYYSANCVACHAADGNSSIAENPKLAGQHSAYLLKQLHDFKSRTRNSAIMQAFVAPMSDADMKNVSAWLSQQKPKPGFAKNADMVALAERIYRGGIADRKIPACAGCHSPNGAGIPTQYPRLAGQQAVYTANQMKAFRNGTRANSLPMADIAIKMSDLEIQAVADYTAGLR